MSLTDWRDLEVPKYPVVECLDGSGCERLIVVGDVHGCLDELLSLMEAVAAGPSDLVVFLGDLVDRGPQSAACLAYAQTVCRNPLMLARCVLGNHEEKHVRYRRHQLRAAAETGYRTPMKQDRVRFGPIHETLSDAALAWCAKLPAAVTVDVGGQTRILTHAGLLPGTGLRQQTKGLVRVRDVFLATGKPATQLDIGGRYVSQLGAVPWDNLHQGPRVVYGHAVHSLDVPRVVNDCYGVDTGCVYGGRLTAYVEDIRGQEVRFVQIPARQVYFDPDTQKDEAA